MAFITVLAVTTVLCVALADVIRGMPVLFYALAIATVVALIAGVYDVAWQRPIILLVRRCLVALALFTVVMFIGVLPKNSWLGYRMRSIRGELSIVACILCLGHMCIYLAPYVTRAFTGSLPANIVVSLTVAVVLFVLLLVLGATSFEFVKKRMRGKMWKRLQLLAYPFFFLIYVHLMLMLAPAALTGATSAIAGIAIYSGIIFSYTVLRLWRFLSERKAGSNVVAFDWMDAAAEVAA